MECLRAFYPATYVPTDACAWQGTLVEIDPTAEALVDAMAAQASTVSTPPVEVMVGDYSGFEFDHAAESDVDFTACDGGGLCIRSNSAQDCTERAYTDEGERATYLVVDLNGERAVIELGQSDPSIDPALIEEARAIFDSIEFVSTRRMTGRPGLAVSGEESCACGQVFALSPCPQNPTVTAINPRSDGISCFRFNGSVNKNCNLWFI